MPWLVAAALLGLGPQQRFFRLLLAVGDLGEIADRCLARRPGVVGLYWRMPMIPHSLTKFRSRGVTALDVHRGLSKELNLSSSCSVTIAFFQFGSRPMRKR